MVKTALGYRRVIGTSKKEKWDIVYIETMLGRELLCSENHPFFVRDSCWTIPASQLKKEDVLYTYHPNILDIVKNIRILRSGSNEFHVISKGMDSVILYDLEIEDNPTFYANGILVHNSTRVKDRRTQVAQAVKLIGKNAAHRYIMTGFPITESVENAWSQFDFLNPGKIVHWNFFAFRNRYCILGGFNQKEIVGYKNLSELVLAIRPWAFTARKEDCLELPPKMYEVRHTDLSDEQRKVYVLAENHIRQELTEGRVTVRNALAETQKLMEISAGFVYTDEGIAQHFESEKEKVILELLEESPGKVVIFTTFTAETDRLETFLKSKGIRLATISAAMSSAERDTVQAEFAKPAGPRVVLSNVKVGGVGLNLQAADTAIFHSNPYSLELRVQAEDRVYRIGSEVHKKITIIDLVSRKTIDQSVLSALKDKRDLAESIIDGILKEKNTEESED
jgi:SNF2 family DNA or RNA helicase